jgi:hypothetical protein
MEEKRKMAVRIQLRRDTAANWTSSNPILRAGEVGIETDTRKLKIGNGTSTWTQITDYVSDEKLNTSTAASTYAPLASPTLTGTPTAPTATAGTNSTQIATTAFVGTAVSALIDAAPGALDTLNELAAAMGDDANFATTLTTSINSKIAKSDITAKGAILIGTGAGTYTSQTVGTNGQVLTANSAQADGVEWTTLNALPSQTGNAGKYLTTDGTTASWAPAATETPHPFAMIG